MFPYQTFQGYPFYSEGIAWGKVESVLTTPHPNYEPAISYYWVKNQLMGFYPYGGKSYYF